MKTVLLDLDGTLADSASMITGHLSAALAGIGLDHSPAELMPLVGPPFETALPEFGLDAEQTATVIGTYRTTYYAEASVSTPLFPGIPALLDRLVAGGLRLALATSKGESAARAIIALHGLTDRFALVAGSDPAVGRVGKAAVVGSVLERLGIDPAEEPVVMVGDRHHDVDGAAEHGIPTIGVTWGYAPDGELSGARAVVAGVDDLAELLAGDDVWSTTRAAV